MGCFLGKNDRNSIQEFYLSNSFVFTIAYFRKFSQSIDKLLIETKIK